MWYSAGLARQGGFDGPGRTPLGLAASPAALCRAGAAAATGVWAVKIEIEAKLRVSDLDALGQRLAELDARCVGRMLEENIFVDDAAHGLKAGDRGLRVRSIRSDDQPPQTVVTFKGPRSDSEFKSRGEIEFTVDHADAALALLAELGYTEQIRFEKHRTRYRLEGCTVELDRLPYLGTFVEIEGPSTQSVQAARERLGLAEHPLVTSSYVAMLASYLDEHDIADRRIGLPDAAS
jgi:adenylate cyclase class 2